MDHKHTLDVPNHADNDASQPLSFLFPPAFYDIELGDDDDVSKPVSKFTSPIYIEMGDEGSELLESKVNEKTNETVKADEDWTRLSSTRSIDTSIVAGFMFQTDAGIKCSITMTENGKRPIRIMIDEKHEFGMFLVVVLRHEKWTTSGDFHLRFVRRVPISAKKCTARMDEAGHITTPSDSGTSSIEESESATADSTDTKEQSGYVVTSSDSGTSSIEKPESATADSTDTKEQCTARMDEAGHVTTPPDSGTSSIEGPESATAASTDTKEHVGPRLGTWTVNTRTVVPPQMLPYVFFRKDGSVVPLARQPESSEEHGDTTDEEDIRAIGAAALRERGKGDGTFPPNMFPSTE